MKKLAMCLAILSAPLCADDYVSVGVGPYLMIPNISVGHSELMELGELDLNVNLSFSHKASLTEAKAALRLPADEYFIGPSIHVNYDKFSGFRGVTSFGAGAVFGKKFDDSFIELSIQENIVSSESFDSIPNLKIRYGVNY